MVDHELWVAPYCSGTRNINRTLHNPRDCKLQVHGARGQSFTAGAGLGISNAGGVTKEIDHFNENTH